MSLDLVKHMQGLLDYYLTYSSALCPELYIKNTHNAIIGTLVPMVPSAKLIYPEMENSVGKNLEKFVKISILFLLFQMFHQHKRKCN